MQGQERREWTMQRDMFYCRKDKNTLESKVMKNITLPLIGAALILLCLSLLSRPAEALLPAGVSLPAPSVSPTVISSGFNTEFFISASFPTMSADFKPLVQILGTSGRWKNIGKLQDNGKGGDPKAGDRAFSLMKKVKLAQDGESISFRLIAKNTDRKTVISPVRVVTRSGSAIIPQGWYHQGFNEGLGVVNFSADQTPSDGPLKSGLAYVSVNWLTKDASITLKDFAMKETSPARILNETTRILNGKNALQITSTSDGPAPDENTSIFVENDNASIVEVGLLFLASSPNRSEMLAGFESFLSNLTLDTPIGGAQ
ncbi:MAG: hypothetical protein WC730_03715 [Patescibacteria group bacterium]